MSRSVLTLGGLLSGWSRFETLWLLVFTAVNLWLFVAWDDTLLGLVTSLTGMMTVVLVAKGRISNYWFGMVNVTLYAWLSYRNRYYGEVMLNLGYFLPMQFVGLWLWTRHRRAGGTGGDEVRVTHLSNGQRVLWLLVSVGATAAYGFLLRALGGELPFFDSTSTVLSVIAMLLMVRRVSEQWLLWITVNVVSIYMWAFAVGHTGRDVTMVVMWSAYLVNAIYGWYNWRRLEEAGSGERSTAAAVAGDGAVVAPSTAE